MKINNSNDTIFATASIIYGLLIVIVLIVFGASIIVTKLYINNNTITEDTSRLNDMTNKMMFCGNENTPLNSVTISISTSGIKSFQYYRTESGAINYIKITQTSSNSEKHAIFDLLDNVVYVDDVNNCIMFTIPDDFMIPDYTLDLKDVTDSYLYNKDNKYTMGITDTVILREFNMEYYDGCYPEKYNSALLCINDDLETTLSLIKSEDNTLDVTVVQYTYNRSTNNLDIRDSDYTYIDIAKDNNYVQLLNNITY